MDKVGFWLRVREGAKMRRIFLEVLMLGRLSALIAAVLTTMVVSSPAGAQTLRISSVTFSAPAPLRAGDIVTVDLAGTPGVRAAFSIRGLIPATQLREVSAGSYHGAVKVPEGKFVRNAPVVGYLGDDRGHAAPVQASRLVTVVDTDAQAPSKMPPVLPEPHAKAPQAAPIAKPVVVPQPEPKPAPQPAPKPTPPPAPADTGRIVITTPADGATLKHMIVIRGSARPGSTVKVAITYNNGLSGLMKLAGDVASQNLAAGKNGEFRMGPIALDGPLATDGLRFTIKAYYPDRVDHGTAEVTVIGKRE